MSVELKITVCVEPEDKELKEVVIRVEDLLKTINRLRKEIRLVKHQGLQFVDVKELEQMLNYFKKQLISSIKELLVPKNVRDVSITYQSPCTSKGDC